MYEGDLVSEATAGVPAAPPGAGPTAPPAAGPGVAGGRERDRGASYWPILGAYLGVTIGLGLLVRRVSGRRFDLPKPADVVLLGFATFKLSRLLTKDKVA